MPFMQIALKKQVGTDSFVRETFQKAIFRTNKHFSFLDSTFLEAFIGTLLFQYGVPQALVEPLSYLKKISILFYYLFC